MPAKLSPEERELRKKERSRAAWARMNSGEAYKHFNPNDDIGYGNEDQWRATAEDAIGDGYTVRTPKPTIKVDADLARLGLTAVPATLASLVRAYRMATLKAHPDAQGGSHEAFLALRAAFDRLKLRVR